jgi:cobalt-zinc-cadmium efflux system protein
MAADAVVALGVVVAGGLMMATGLAWIDAAVSLIISILVGWGSWSMLRQSLDLALDAVPEGTDLNAIREFLAALPGVTAVTDLHVWPMSTTEVALTAHVTAPDGIPSQILAGAQHEMSHQFEIAHSTIQVDTNASHCCPLAI